ncbi:hypothetical protein AYB33_17445 [Leptospira santarosai]|uniref:hypothetical protein n=1 Tax=Leptospira santarosai TaxID=28183 RepID=UPI00077858BB|nr:hypothetical protein [Leptospira santarosai]KXZ29345.1 hypothetical protein AYB33_17445 [Leptospira santarosai]
MINYWLVGASWGGQDDQSDKFLRRGHWFLGHLDEDKPNLAARRDQIKPKDRIAIKKMLGQGSSNVEILALGIVKEIDEDKKVYVDWLVKGVNREVPSKGAYASIHGPFSSEDEWTRLVFHI